MGYYMAGGELPSWTVESVGSGGARYQASGTGDDLVDGPPRRMDKWNGRALRRAMTRVKRFERFARKAVAFTNRVRMRKRRR